jgi:predicted transcriptional regulator with HTH domain
MLRDLTVMQHLVMRALFKSRLSLTKIQRLMSVLVGANYLTEVSQFGHLAVSIDKQRLLEVKEGFKEEETDIRLALTEIYQRGDVGFLRLVEDSRSVN